MITTHDWHCRLTCGKELHGKDIGSFANVKNRTDILDLWVETGAGRVYAHRRQGMKHSAFDFYVHVAVEENGKAGKHFKLVTIYAGEKLIRHVTAKGNNYIERIVL